MNNEQRVFQIFSGFQEACVLMAAAELDIFEKLRNPVTIEDVAGKAEGSNHSYKSLLNALVTMGIVEATGKGFVIATPWRDYTSSDSKTSLLGYIRLASYYFPVWQELSQFVRCGKPVSDIVSTLEFNAEASKAFTQAMHGSALTAAAAIAQSVNLEGARRMLDVGGGAGTYSLLWAGANPQLSAVVLDLPTVLEHTQSYINDYSLEDRVFIRPGNFVTEELGKNEFDLILLANVIHMLPPEEANRLLDKAYRALAFGGRIIINEFSLNSDGPSDLEDCLFDLQIRLITEAGRVYTLHEQIGLLEKAGLNNISHFKIDATPSCIVVGQK